MRNTDSAIAAHDVSARFGRVALFEGLTLTVAPGESLAIVGPNGSGKSTLLEILAGLRRPTAGRVLFTAGGDDDARTDRSRIGFMGPRVEPYPDLTGMENLLFAARGGSSRERAAALMERFALRPHRDKLTRHYSSGMRQRLKLAIALVNDPPALFLDEPGAMLDEAGRALLRAEIDARRAERIIVMATNDADEAALCSRRTALG
ncbi:MAG TPA: ABC transporter ATP-binding protein [Spirochaetota bacterium]|nr:ABC transporter ATP-binding protein [Spirochaetota bacterium]HNT11417.1 ABC transporter ATP-binding protein [Spirochaetota bacterium]